MERLPVFVSLPLVVGEDSVEIEHELLYQSEEQPCSMFFELTFSLVDEDGDNINDVLYPPLDVSWDGEWVDLEPWSDTLLTLSGVLAEYCHIL